MHNKMWPSAQVLMAGLFLVPFLTGCSGQKKDAPPPRSSEVAPTARETSFISVPITADQSALTTLIEEEIPHTLWTINEKSDRCIPPQKVKVFGSEINVTPPISCTIIGEVRRGPVHIHGEGRDIIADIPLHATIRARDVAGLLKGETATGSALARAHIRLDITSGWQARGTVKLSYDWTVAPGIDFLGQRITFTHKADEKLEPIRRDLEKRLPAELSKLNIREQAEALWRQSFTSLSLNETNPPVWMRIAPQRLIYDGYSFRQNKLQLRVALEAITETFVGERPANPAQTPLSALERAPTDGKLYFFSPVIADYAELQPVVLKALLKRATRPFEIPAIGPVSAQFEQVEIYGTENGRIAVGITLSAWPTGTSNRTKGKLWLTALPVNAPGSAKLTFHDLDVTGSMNDSSRDLLIKLGNSPAISTLVASSLTQNLTHDLNELIQKIRNATASLQEGDFMVRFDLENYEIGSIKAYGNGLHLPVRMTGNAQIDYKPD